MWGRWGLVSSEGRFHTVRKKQLFPILRKSNGVSAVEPSLQPDRVRISLFWDRTNSDAVLPNELHYTAVESFLVPARSTAVPPTFEHKNDSTVLYGRPLWRSVWASN